MKVGVLASAPGRFRRGDPTWILAIGVLLALGWSYSDSWANPTFLGDQGIRLDQADRIVVGTGPRVWLPLLQLHLFALYQLGAPLIAFQLVPCFYTAVTVLLLVLLGRAITGDRGLVATALLLPGFALSSFHWLGHTLYQEVIMIPLFLAGVYLRCFAPERWPALLCVLALGMLTREIFWIWWLVLLVLDRRRLRAQPAQGIASLALAAIPLLWLWTTQKSLLPAINVRAGTFTWEGVAERAVHLVGLMSAECLLVPLVAVAGVWALTHGSRSCLSAGYTRFSLLSLALAYGYILVCDPWQATPDNTRMLVPLFAHLLGWVIFAWQAAREVAGRARWMATVLAAVAMLSLIKLPAVVTTLRGAPAATARQWEPLRLGGQPVDRSWRSTLSQSLTPLRAASPQRLRVDFVGVSEAEYRKYWVAVFLYDDRRRQSAGMPRPDADVIVAPPDFAVDGWRGGASLRIAPDLERAVLLRQP